MSRDTDMALAHPEGCNQKRIRLWPGVALAACSCYSDSSACRQPGDVPPRRLGALLCTLLIVLWWLFFSRAPWGARGCHRIDGCGRVDDIAPGSSVHCGRHGFRPAGVHRSCARPRACRRSGRPSGFDTAMGADDRRDRSRVRRVHALADRGVTGDAASQLKWRWTPTAEDRLLAQASEEPQLSAPAQTVAAIPSEPVAPAAGATAAALPAAPAAAKPEPSARATETAAEWPGFRGRDRNSVIRDVRIDSDWSTSPPKELWRRTIGPGWSSFAVRGDYLYTQEQRGEDEIVACYKVSTGQPVWKSRSSPVLGVECRRRSTRDASPQRRPCLHAGRDRNLERPSRRQRCRRVVPRRSGRHGNDDSRLWLLWVAARRGRSGHRCGQRQARRLRRGDGHAWLYGPDRGRATVRRSS